MLKKIYKELIILVLAFLAIWGAFSFLKAPKLDFETNISIETEEELGDLLIESYLEANHQLQDSSVNRAIEIITNRLTSSLDSSNYYYKFYVIDSPEINAFATLGGHIVIFSGLLKFADTPEEIAAVLAHEIGHVEERHVSKMLVKKLGLSVITSLLTGGDPALIIEITEMAASNTFSRKHEGEADDFGLKLLEKSSISPSQMATIFRRMKKEMDSKYEKQLEFISTHPEMDKRIRKSLRYKTKKEFTPKEFNIDWEGIKTSLGK